MISGPTLRTPCPVRLRVHCVAYQPLNERLVRSPYRTVASASLPVWQRAHRARRSPRGCWRGSLRALAPRGVSRDPFRSGRDSRRRRRAVSSTAPARARRRPDISFQSSSDSRPIARSNSSSLIDRSVNCFSRSSATRVRFADHHRPIFFGGHQRPQCAQRRIADECRRSHQDAEQDDGGWSLSASHERDRRGAAERRQDKELPGLEAGIAVRSANAVAWVRLQPDLA